MVGGLRGLTRLFWKRHSQWTFSFNTVKLCQLTEDKTACVRLGKGKARRLAHRGAGAVQRLENGRGEPSPAKPSPAKPSWEERAEPLGWIQLSRAEPSCRGDSGWHTHAHIFCRLPCIFVLGKPEQLGKYLQVWLFKQEQPSGEHATITQDWLAALLLLEEKNRFHKNCFAAYQLCCL